MTFNVAYVDPTHHYHLLQSNKLTCETPQASTCQCSQCRKQTGSLVFRVQKVPRSSFALTAQATLKVYKVSPPNSRAFCGDCGGLVYWAAEDEDEMSVCVGSFDDDVLQKHGRVLTYAERHVYCANEIPGVTDHLPGRKYKDSDD